MTISTNNVNQKKCYYCDSNKTDIINKEGTLVFSWLRNPYKKSTWICGNCSRSRLHLKSRFRSLAQIRELYEKVRDQNVESSSVSERKCDRCGTDKTFTAITKKVTPYPKWNNHPLNKNTRMCGKCRRILVIGRKFKFKNRRK